MPKTRMIPPIKLATSEVNFNISCDIGVKVLLVVSGILAVEEKAFVVEFVGNEALVGTEQKYVPFTSQQSLIVELCE